MTATIKQEATRSITNHEAATRAGSRLCTTNQQLMYPAGAEPPQSQGESQHLAPHSCSPEPSISTLGITATLLMHVRWHLGTGVSCQCNNQQVKAINKGPVVITLAVRVNIHGMKLSSKIRATEYECFLITIYVTEKPPQISAVTHTC